MGFAADITDYAGRVAVPAIASEGQSYGGYGMVQHPLHMSVRQCSVIRAQQHSDAMTVPI